VRRRTFGRTGWQVSEIAFGGWQLGGDWGPVDGAESIKTLHHAYESGINFVDTAELYGSGHSEVFNMFDQRPATTLFPAGAATGTAFIARVPFDSGALIGNWTEDTYAGWAPGSVPHTLFRGERFTETLRRMNRLKELCAPYYPTLAEAAIRYTLSPGEVATVIPGIRNPAEVDMNVAYSDGQAFPPELLERVAPHSWPRNFYK
jgi:aryl-alcohol dehydrogenase-like predicted oxidoreductase